MPMHRTADTTNHPVATNPGAMEAESLRRDCERFIQMEARLLDQRRFREWMDLFTEDGTYWVPSVPNQKSPHDYASLFFDDRALMKTRIDRLEHPRIHVQSPPSRTVHILGSFAIESDDNASGETLVSSAVLMVEYRDEKQRIFAGRQTHRLRRDENAECGWRIAQKRVDLVNCDSSFDAMAVPI
jgi:3-phenylpropionate/cinnamic acid dioxygenase small subunit